MKLQRHTTGLQSLSRPVAPHRTCRHPAASRLLRPPAPTQQCRGARVVVHVAAPSTTSVATTKQPKKDIEGPSTDPSVIYERLQRVRTGWRSACRCHELAGPTQPHAIATAAAAAPVCSWCCRTGWSAHQPSGAWLVWWRSRWGPQLSGEQRQPGGETCATAGKATLLFLLPHTRHLRQLG